MSVTITNATGLLSVIPSISDILSLNTTNVTSKQGFNVFPTKAASLDGGNSQKRNNHTFKIILFTLLGIVSFIGILGNVCVCYIIKRGKKMYTVANVFLLNLAVADIFVLSFVYIIMIIRSEASWPFGEVFCKISVSLSDSFFGVSMGCITAIAIYRYRMILHPMTTHVSFTHARIIIIIIWVIALCVISVPLCFIVQLHVPPCKPEAMNSSDVNASTTLSPLLRNSSSDMLLHSTLPHWMHGSGSSMHTNNYSYVTSMPLQSNKPNASIPSGSSASKNCKRSLAQVKCISNWLSVPVSYRKAYQIVQLSWYVLPLFVILFTYLRIRTHLQKTLKYEWATANGNNVAQSGLQSRVVGIKRALTLLAPVVIVFALLLFPFNLIRFLSLVMNISAIKHIYTYIDIAGALMIANSCSNPFIYYVMSKDFRDQFRKQFRKLMRCKRWRGDEGFLLTRNSTRSASFKSPTNVETLPACHKDNDINNHNVLNYTWEKYAVRESESPLTKKSPKLAVTFSSDLMVANDSELLIEPIPDPDRETII